MTDLIIQGINGRMGHTLVEKISARSDCRIVAGVDQKAGQIGDIPVYVSLEDLPEAKGIVIDFTSPAGGAGGLSDNKKLKFRHHYSGNFGTDGFCGKPRL